jgi:KaiC/GvpD/RAD55 family RecA-like ATPase
MTTRRIRVVKYRGAAHSTNEYPFLIGKNGISILKERAPLANLNEERGPQQLDLQRQPRQAVRSLVRTRRSAARLQR